MTIAAILASLLLPLVVLRGRTLIRWYAIDLSLWALAWLLLRRGLEADPHLGFVAFVAIRLAILGVFIARGENVRFTAGRAALIGAVVYALLIPQQTRIAKVDGDEPFYLLLTESIVRDGDVDLRNQYATLDRSETDRPDLVPQWGDPVGPHGEQYSRHEPFLPLLLSPGYVAGGLHGAVAIIALFGALLIRSTIRWMEDEGVSDAAIRAAFPFFALGPPILFYAVRIWPEVPAAFFFVEAIRGVRAQRPQRWIPALLGLVLLKLRFVLIAAGLLAALAFERRKAARRFFRTPGAARTAAIAIVVILAPLAILWFLTGDPTSVHDLRQIRPEPWQKYVRGLFGLLADGMSGIAFQAPFHLFGIFALFRWKEAPRGFRLGMLASLPYLVLLVPREEWFGGWAPPLRYIVFLMPVLALGAAAMWDRLSRGAIALVAAWTVALVIHGATWPHRLFHIFNGENNLGEWLSRFFASDFSRLFPSFIRPNDARWIGIAIVLLLVTIGLRRWKIDLLIPFFALALSAGFLYGRRPATVVHFEDAHVRHEGGKLSPDYYTFMRSTYRGGWVLEAGGSSTFLIEAGTYRLHFVTGLGAMIEIAGQAIQVPAREGYQTVRVTIPESGRVTLRCVTGAVNLDFMERVE